MIYQYVAPAPALRGLVRDYLIAHFVFDASKSIPVKPYSPKPEQGITFFPRGHVTIADPLTGQSRQAPRISIFGQQVSRYDFGLTSEYLMFRVHFRPGGLFRVLGVPLSELADDYSDAAALSGHGLREVEDRLEAASSYAQMVEIVNQYLLGEVSRLKRDINSVDRVAACLESDPTCFSLDWLADQACLSPRQLNRRFTERMGVGPKLYSRIVRFHQAYRFKEVYPACDWLSIAIRFGYTDYQHLAKEFKQFANVTPTIWVREDESSPENVLNLYR